MAVTVAHYSGAQAPGQCTYTSVFKFFFAALIQDEKLRRKMLEEYVGVEI